MNKLKVFIAATTLALIPQTTFACIGGDETDGTNDCVETVLIAPVNENKELDNRFQADEKLETKGEWKSSVFFAGNNVKDESLVSGIGLLAGNLIEVGGIYDYGLVAGNNVSINGEYKNDAFLAGNMINITKDAKFGRDLYVAGNVVTISAPINGNVYVAANKIVLDSVEIKGDLVVSAPNIEVSSKTNIVGLFKHNDDVAINGEITYSTEEVYKNEVGNIKIEYNFKGQLISAAFSLACSITTAVLLAFVGRKFFALCHEKTKTYGFVDGVTDFGIGLLALVMIPIVVLFAMVTIVGFPAALILLLAYIIMVCLSSIVFAEWLGEKILKKCSIIINAIFGLLILTIVKLIPVVGSFISFVAVTMGIGLIIKVLFRKKNIIK